MTTNFLVSQTPEHLLHGTVSNAKLCYSFLNCHHLVFCDDSVNFRLITFCGGGSSLTTARQISDIPVAIPEVFHPTLNTDGNHAGISIEMTKLIKDVCSRISLLYDEFNCNKLAKQYIIYSHSVTVDWVTIGVHVRDLYFTIQKTDTATGPITPSPVMSIKHT
jgi:hypothetical protein